MTDKDKDEIIETQQKIIEHMNKLFGILTELLTEGDNND